jgi:hypothetical protein
MMMSTVGNGLRCFVRVIGRLASGAIVGAGLRAVNSENGDVLAAFVLTRGQFLTAKLGGQGGPLARKVLL